MAHAFKLPDLGEGIHEGEVLAVLVKVGDQVKEGDPILEVETDKAAVEIPSPYTGRVADVLVKAGDLVKVGQEMMRFDTAAADAGAKSDILTQRSESAPAQAASRKAQESVPADPSKRAESQLSVKSQGPVPASPATRRLARELGVDLHQVHPSGPAGLVTADDVRAHAQGGASIEQRASAPESIAEAAPLALPTEGVPPLPDFTKWGPVQRVPLRSIRRATARQMVLAWSQIPHIANQEWADVTRLEAFRQKHKDAVATQNGKLTLTVFTMKAAALALKAFPRFNATLDSTSGEIILKQYYHLGLAVETEEGLVVPVLRDVDRKSIREVAQELQQLVLRARERKNTLEEMQGGTFTITNVGPLGGAGHFTPIINYPQVAILGMGAARMQPAVRPNHNGGHDIVARLMMPMVLSVDHRVLDGADAIRFLHRVIGMLEDPDEMLLSMT